MTVKKLIPIICMVVSSYGSIGGAQDLSWNAPTREHFKHAHDFAVKSGYAAGLPTFATKEIELDGGGHANYNGIILLKPQGVELGEVDWPELEKKEADARRSWSAMMRAIDDIAHDRGFIAGFPNGKQGKGRNRVVVVFVRPEAGFHEDLPRGAFKGQDTQKGRWFVLSQISQESNDYCGGFTDGQAQKNRVGVFWVNRGFAHRAWVPE